MPLTSGFGSGPFGEDPFGQTNYGRKVLLENLPEVYRDEDRKNDLLFTRFIQSLYPNINEFRKKLDEFPSIRDAENIPKDELGFQALVVNGSSEIQIIDESVLPLLVPADLVFIAGDDPSENLTVAVITAPVDAQFTIGSAWPFATGVRTATIRGDSFQVLVQNGSTTVTAVPDCFPDIKVGDFVQVELDRYNVTNVDESTYRLNVTPLVVNTTQKADLTRLSRLGLLTLLAKDIGVSDDPEKPEDIRRSIVFNSPELFKLKGTERSYTIRGGMEGVNVEVFQFNEVPCLTCRPSTPATGTITVVDGSRLIDAETVTLDDGINPPTVFEFDDDGAVVPGNVPVPFIATTTPNEVAVALSNAINGVGASLKISVPILPENPTIIDQPPGNQLFLQHEDPGAVGNAPILETVADTGFVVDGMEVRVPARGTVTTVAGASLIDGETVVVDDSVNPAVTFEFDDDASVVETPTLRAVVFTAADTADTVASTLRDAIDLAPTLDISSSQILDGNTVELIHSSIGPSFEAAILETVVDASFVVSGMTAEGVGVTYCESSKTTRDPMLYVANFDDIPADVEIVDTITTDKYFDVYGRRAFGSITAIAGLDLIDGETFTIDDGVHAPTVFEFDKGGGIVAGNIAVTISDASTALDVRNAVRDAINGVGSSLDVTAIVFGDGLIVSLVADVIGITANNAVVTTVANPGFVVAGLSGGVEGVDGEITFPVVFTGSRSFRIHGVSFSYTPGPGLDEITLTSQADLITGLQATGRVTCIPGVNIADGETVTLADGSGGLGSIVTFEFDKNAATVPGNVPVPITDLFSNDDVATALETAINASTLTIVATNVGGGNVDLENSIEGTQGNLPITDTVVDTSFVVAGMTGGLGGDIVEFGAQQRTVTVLGAPVGDPPFQDVGAVVKFDAPLIGLPALGSAERVTRLPDLNAFGDYIRVANTSYRVVSYNDTVFQGTVDLFLRDSGLQGVPVLGRRSRQQAVTRQPALGYCRLPALKIHAFPEPDSFFFTGSDSIQKFTQNINEVKPLHVKIIDTQFECTGKIKVTVPVIQSALGEEVLIPVTAFYDSVEADTTAADSSITVTIETP